MTHFKSSSRQSPGDNEQNHKTSSRQLRFEPGIIGIKIYTASLLHQPGLCHVSILQERLLFTHTSCIFAILNILGRGKMGDLAVSTTSDEYF
jgi:hypothetical protein